MASSSKLSSYLSNIYIRLLYIEGSEKATFNSEGRDMWSEVTVEFRHSRERAERAERKENQNIMKREERETLLVRRDTMFN